jgi:hypothetical protein
MLYRLRTTTTLAASHARSARSERSERSNQMGRVRVSGS